LRPLSPGPIFGCHLQPSLCQFAIHTYLELRRVNSLLTQKRDHALHTLGDVCHIVKCEIVRALIEWLYVLFQAGQDTEAVCQLQGV